MTRKDALAALALFGRYNDANRTSHWNIKGSEIVCNMQCGYDIPATAKEVKARMRLDCRPKETIRVVPVHKMHDIVGIHRRCTYSRVVYYLQDFAARVAAQEEKSEDLIAAFARFRGRLYCWNGHHRMLAARLLGIGLRAAVYDLDSPEAKRAYNKKCAIIRARKAKAAAKRAS